MWDVKPSWIEEPIPPTPTHRIPLEYQEVEWVQRISGPDTIIPNSIATRSIKMKSRVSGVVGGSGNCLTAWDSVYSWFLRIALNNGSYMIIINARGSTDTSVVRALAFNGPNFDTSIVLEAVDSGFVLTAFNQSVICPLTLDGGDDPLRSFHFWERAGSASTFQIYETIFENVKDGSLMYDFVPCFRKADGFCGFYDLVTSKFYSGQTEAGQYVHGGNIN